jgi:phage-related minor tail protein
MADQTINIVLTGNASGLESAGRKAESTLRGVAAGAKQAAGATNDVARVMPQLTDVFVSLGSGQSPFTVMLQQGGQLKDMFGGIAPASRAVGAAVGSMVSPLTVAGAAVAALSAGYLAGRSEGDAFARALILSGNAAGTSTNQLAGYATSVGAITGNVGEASAALATFAASGAVPVSMLEQVTAGAIRLARVGGPSVEETAKRFAELGKDPLQASIKLNESTNFLTESVYRQIKSLSEQGKTVEAAGVAMKALAQTNDAAATQMEARLGLLEKAYKSLGKTIAGVWDGIKGIGREDALADQLKTAEKQLAEAGAARNGGNALQAAERRQAIQDRIAGLKEQIRLEFQAADAKRRQGDATQAVIEWDKQGEQYLSKREQRERAIAQIREQGRRAGASELEISKRIAEASEKFKDPKAPKTSTGRAANPFAAEQDAAKEWADTLRDLERIQNTAAASAHNYSAAQTRLLAYFESPAFLKASDEQKKLAVAQFEAASAAEQQVAAEKERNRLATESAKAYESMLSSLYKAAEAAGEQVRQLEDEAAAAQMAGYMNISLKEAIEQVTIARLREKQSQSVDPASVEAIEKEIEARTKLLGLAASADFVAREDKDREERMQKERRAAEQIGQSLSDAIMNGGQSAGELLRNYFKTLVLKPIIDAAVNPLASSASSGISSLLASWSSSAKYNGAVSAGNSFSSTAWEQYVPKFASGGRHAGGVRIVGERGAELEVTGPSRIFSADQTSKMLAGAGSSGGATVNLTPVINIDARSDANQVAAMVGQALQQQQRAMQEQLRAAGVVR